MRSVPSSGPQFGLSVVMRYCFPFFSQHWGVTVTNEMYLYVSYFAAIIFGLIFALVTMAILRKPHKKATTDVKAGKLGSFIRCIFPPWLILAALLGFISVSYFDCSHTDYAQIVADRNHLINKTQEQLSMMLICIAIALFTYCLLMVPFLWAAASRRRQSSSIETQK